MISIPVDADLDKKLKQLNENLKTSGEEIVAQNTVQVEDQTVMVISIKESVQKKKKLLLDGKRVLSD